MAAAAEALLPFDHPTTLRCSQSSKTRQRLHLLMMMLTTSLQMSLAVLTSPTKTSLWWWPGRKLLMRCDSVLQELILLLACTDCVGTLCRKLMINPPRCSGFQWHHVVLQVFFTYVRPAQCFRVAPYICHPCPTSHASWRAKMLPLKHATKSGSVISFWLTMIGTSSLLVLTHFT